VFWQQLRQHETSGTDLEEKEEMESAEGEAWPPASGPLGPCTHDNTCFFSPGLGSKEQAKGCYSRSL
jgi:hypothetical protein